MLPRRLSLFLAIILVLPTAQVVNPQRDVNAEENVAVSFASLRRHAGLPLLMRSDGTAFARAACLATEHGSSDTVWVEDATYTAAMYSSAQPESADVIAQLGSRAWSSDRRFVVGACSASTPTFPAGRDWVAVGVVTAAAERSVADLLTGKPKADPHNAE